MRANEANPDPNTSQAVATSIMLALLARARTGRGQAVEVTMLQANAWANADEAFYYPGRPSTRLPDDQCYGLGALYRLYETSEGWVFLACPSEHEWLRLCDALKRPDLAEDNRFATATARAEHDMELAERLAEIFALQTADQWEASLTRSGVACVRADSDVGSFLEEHPQAAANQMTVEAESPRFGKYLRHGMIVSFSEASCRFAHGAFPGEHTEPLMRELGYNPEHIADLRARGIIHWEETRRLAAAR